MQIKEVDVEKTEIFSIGRQYSKNVLAIHFVNLPNLNNKYIYYKIDDIEQEIPLVSDLFIVSRPLTMHSGKVKAQIIVRDESNETIDLTKNFTMIIEASNYSGIGDDENYPDDPNIKNYFVKIDEKVNSFEELANLVQSKLDNGDFVGAQGPKGEKGDPGEKGEPGDVTEEYRNLASQIEQNASDAQTSATNAQTSASNAQKSFNDAKTFANQTKTELNQIKNDTNTLKDEANTSALNAKASEDKAKEYADNLQASTDDISKLKEDLDGLQTVVDSKANKSELTKTNLSIDALYKLNKGQTYDVLEQEREAYSVDVPSGAKYVGIDKVGGHSEVIDGEIVSSQTDRVDVASADSTVTQQITTGFPVLNSAGSVYDYIDLNEGKLHQRVGVVDLGTIDWRYDGDSNERFRYNEFAANYNAKMVGALDKPNFLSNMYIAMPTANLSNYDMCVGVYGVGGWLLIKNSAYTNTEAFKTAMKGVMLYYELAEPVITDITIPTELSDWLIVETGCSITFHNLDEGKRLLIPNKETFIRKLDEVTV